MLSTEKEFYRRVVAPYEDSKAVENGDVYTKLLEKMRLPHEVRGPILP